MHKWLFVIVFISNTALAQKDTFNVYYSIGNYQLTAVQKKSIDSLLYHDVIAPGRRVGIIGYADIIGDEKSNRELSEKRARSVAIYLQYMGVDSQNIEQVTGVGEVNRAENSLGYPQDRRVAIIPGGFKKIKPAKIVDLTKVAANATVALDNILFVGGCAIFLPESMSTLEALYQTMRDNPKLKIKIEGHVCCRTFHRDRKAELTARELREDELTQIEVDDVSSSRAKAVYDYLVKRDIAPDRLKWQGFGITKPLIIDGKLNIGDPKNRRVEIRVLAK